MPDEWSPSKKKCFLVPSGSHDDPDRHHMFVVLTDVCDEGFHLAVSVSSIKVGIKHDTTCELEAGCHDFITKKSFVMYGRIEKLRALHIKKCVSGWVYKSKGEVADDIFNEICAGITQSDFTPGWASTYFKEK